jgi:hypothetical protein
MAVIINLKEEFPKPAGPVGLVKAVVVNLASKVVCNMQPVFRAQSGIP